LAGFSEIEKNCIISRRRDDGFDLLIKSINSCRLIGWKESSMVGDCEKLQLGEQIPGAIPYQ